MKRLTTDNPKGNFETLMNFAYVKDKKVFIPQPYKDDIGLCEYIAKLNKKDCNCTAESILEGSCLECDRNCELGMLYFCAVQAAELRERLKQYEDKFENGTLVELPLSIDDRETLTKAIDSLYLYRIFPIECCEECPKFQKEKNNCCQELCDVYDGKSNKYNPNQDWEFMCENCPLEIEKTQFTLQRYEEAVKLKQGEIEYRVSDKVCLLTKEEAEAKLKELNNGR